MTRTMTTNTTTKTLARLTKSTWFTLESTAKRRHPALAKQQPQQQENDKGEETWELHLQQAVKDDGVATSSNWTQRRTWNEQDWIQVIAEKPAPWIRQFFMNVFLQPLDPSTTAAASWSPLEEQLVESYLAYMQCYQEQNHNNTQHSDPTTTAATAATTTPHDTLRTLGRTVDRLLGDVADHNHLGDPVANCHYCQRNALGRPLRKCTRCQQVAYCSVHCQKEDWRAGRPRTHKSTCRPPSARQLDALVRTRFRVLRRQGKNVPTAMATARREYKHDAQGEVDATAQVAAMFGLR